METEIIKKINECFHDEEAQSFHKRHEERIGEESEFYKKLFKTFSRENKESIKVLDIASGTGLVAAALPESGFRVVCADISDEMLKVAKEKLKAIKGIDYIKCDAEKLPFENETFDMITCNAAMHHFPSVEKFTEEVKRVLSLAGTLVISFESNRRFWTTKPISLIYRLLTKINISAKKDTIGYDRICERVNKNLMKEGIVDRPLSKSELLRYVDIHSPNAGEKIDYSKGFDIDYLTNDIFKGYENKVVYHYDGMPELVKVLIKLFFPKAAPRFSIISRKKVR